MTIAAAYVVSDGVVLGVDSSTTVEVDIPNAGKGVVQLLNHSQKIFEVGSNSRIGICTYGCGGLGTISHRTAIACLADKISAETTIEQATDLFIGIVSNEISQKENFPLVGYFLGGWNPGTHQPECFQIEFRQAEVTKKSIPQGLCAFSGDPAFFTRVFRGFDPQLISELKMALVNHLKQDGFENEFDSIMQQIAQKYSIAGYPDLPIREAIDFIHSYLHITIKAQKFRFGPPSCGGSIEIGFVTTDRNFRWARHKAFYSAITGQEGEYDDL